MNEKMYSFFRRYGLVIVLIIAIFFRFFNLAITPPGLYPDEAMDGTNAQEAVSTGNYKVFYPENNGREGLFINIQAFLLKIFKVNEPWVLRSESAFFGVITVLGIYLLVQYIFRKRPYAHLAGFLPAFFTAISFWHINFSRISFRAIMAPAFLVWGVYLLIRSLERIRENDQISNFKSQINSNYQNSENNPKQKKSWNLGFNAWFLSILGGLVYGLGMHSYIAYRATPLLIIFIYLMYRWLYKVDFKKLFLGFVFYVTASLIVFAPLGIYFIKNPADFMGRTSQVSIFSGGKPLIDLGLNVLKTLGMFDVRGDSNWRHNFSGAPEIYWFVGIFFIVGIFSLIRKLRKVASQSDGGTLDEISEKNNEFKLLWWISMAWMAVAMLPVVISNEGIPHALRSILMIPPAYIFAGLGALVFINFIETKSKQPLINISLSVIAMALICQVYVAYFVLWAQNPNVAGAFNENYVQIGRQLNELPQQIKKYVIVNAGGVLVRGIPMPSQTIMFITDTFTPDKQKQKNIYYLLPEQENQINTKDSIVFYLEPK
jgi:hypothetical protein